MTRPLLLDLFCGAGGAAKGYHDAGFDVIGVDIEPQPHYPYEFHQADALSILRTMVDYPNFSGELWRPTTYAAVHASPPCHDHSTVTGRNRKANGIKGTGWMLDATIDTLRATGLPWVVENVGTAKFPADVHRVQLCGSSFGLDVRRHRWFATNIPILEPPCAHHLQTPRFRSLDSRQKSLATVIGVHGHLNYPGDSELRKRAMGIDWMTNAELSQAIPPAYTRHIGSMLMEYLAHENVRGARL